jgi:uncharacterized integral membrane protein
MISARRHRPRRAEEQTETMAYASENGRPPSDPAMPLAPEPPAESPDAPRPTAPSPTAPSATGPGSDGLGSSGLGFDEPGSIGPGPDAGGVLEPRPADRPGPAGLHPDRPASQLRQRVPRTRIGAVWLGVVAGFLALILLIIFVAQNTARVRIHFLWMTGDFPIAVAFLIAGVGGALIAIAVSAARIIQLRRLVRRRPR